MVTTNIAIGPVSDIKHLYSYPPNCHEICFLEQSLEETVRHYIESSLKRDGFSTSNVEVEIQDNDVIVKIDGSGGEPYRKLLPDYLDAGRSAFAASKQLRAEDRWRYNWRFFLPHGIAMVNHFTVQLLHFPPDYVLERDQDYLTAHTTIRWAELLIENGAQAETTVAFQNIVDIAPIAAPSGDGQFLDGVYEVYNEYIISLLKLWLPVAESAPRPLVAFGFPVRKWLKENYRADLDVLNVSRIQIHDNLTVPIIAANHPSFIYNAVKRLEDDPNTPEDERVAIGMRIMQQDLIAAKWQVDMAANPSADPSVILHNCRTTWANPNKQQRICELTYQQAFNKKPSEAQQLCVHLPHIEADVFGITPRFAATGLDRTIARLREEIGAGESAPPDNVR